MTTMLGYTIGERTLGVDIVESLDVVDTVEDWSKVRSHGRARRRMRQGHKQNITYRTVPKRTAVFINNGRTMIVHPAFVREIRKRLFDHMDRYMEREWAKGIYSVQTK